jgi:hypothetical protein
MPRALGVILLFDVMFREEGFFERGPTVFWLFVAASPRIAVPEPASRLRLSELEND